MISAITLWTFIFQFCINIILLRFMCYCRVVAAVQTLWTQKVVGRWKRKDWSCHYVLRIYMCLCVNRISSSHALCFLHSLFNFAHVIIKILYWILKLKHKIRWTIKILLLVLCLSDDMLIFSVIFYISSTLQAKHRDLLLKWHSAPVKNNEIFSEESVHNIHSIQ